MIYVDADACPVKAEVLKVAERHGFKVTFVANSGLRPSRDPMVHNVIVSASFDAADDWIAERAHEGDIVVTADVPLAGSLRGRRRIRHRPVRPRLRQEQYRHGVCHARPRRNTCARPAKARATMPPSRNATAPTFLETLDRLARQTKK